MTTIPQDTDVPAAPTTHDVSPAPNGMTAVEFGNQLTDTGGREVKPPESETIGSPVSTSTKYDSVLNGMDTTKEIARVASYREIDKIVVYVDAIDPVMLDRPEVKTAAYMHRLHYGLGNSGIEIVGAPYRVRPESKDEQPTLYEPQPNQVVWRRLFNLNVGA